MNDSTKLVIEITPEMEEVLDKLERKSGRTRINVLKTAIVLLDVATEAIEDGHRVGILDPPSESGHGPTLIREIVGIK